MTPPRILVIGSNGLLGQKVLEMLVRGTPATITAASIEPHPLVSLQSVRYLQLDITSKKEVKHVVSVAEPEVIINCAAMTNVDACEKEREAAWKLNVGGVENVVEAAKKFASRLVHISSDYVFDGKSGPYHEDDRPAPLSYYGKTKLASENVLRASDLPFFIARTLVLYGYAEGVRANFALWLIEQLKKGSVVRIVDDQYGNPTLVDDLAFGIMKGVDLGKTGIYNIAGRDILNRYDFAVKLARVFGLNEKLLMPIKTLDLSQPAPRPLRSGLITLKAESELGYKPSTADEGLAILKSQLSRAGTWDRDRAPAPGRRPAAGESSGKRH